MFRQLIAVACMLALLPGCGRDPEKTKQKLLRTGDKYFENGKYKEASIIYRRAIQKDKLFGEAYYRLGKVQLKLKRYSQALGALTRAVQLLPDREDAYRALTNLYLQIYAANPKRSEAALGEIQRLTEQLEQYHPDSLDVLRVRGYVALFQKHYNEARGHFQTAYERSPENDGIVSGYVRSLASSGELEKALAIGNAYLKKKPKSARIYEILYLAQVSAGRLDDALAMLLRECAAIPDRVIYRIQLANHYRMLNQADKMRAALDEVLAHPDQFPRGGDIVGEFYQRIGDTDRALEVYRQAAETHPDRQVAYQTKMAEIFAVRGDNDAAYRLVKKALSQDANNSQALALRGALRLKSHDQTQLAAAVTDLEAALEKMPNNPVLRFNLAEAYRAQGKLDRAIVEYQTAIEERHTYMAPRFRLASLHLQRRQPAETVAEANEVLTLDPNNVRAQLLRAGAWVQMGQLEQARTSFESILKKHPDTSDATYNLGLISYRQRRFDDARNYFTRLYKRTPPDIRGLLGMANVDITTGRGNDAVQLLKDMVAKNPDHAGLRVAYGTVLNSVHRFDDAAKQFRAVLRKWPENSRVHQLLATAYFSKGDLAEAEKNFKEASRLAPKDTVPVLYLGMIAERRGAFQQAAADYKKVIDLNPKHAVALNNLAYILAETTSDLDQALTYVQEARSLSPKDPDVADTLAYIYLKKNLPDSALPILSEVVAKHPSVVIWRYHLALAHYQKGHIARARDELRTALTYKPSDEEKHMIQELLAKANF